MYFPFAYKAPIHLEYNIPMFFYCQLILLFYQFFVYIDNTNLTKEYIHFIRPLKGKKIKRNKSRESKKVFYNFKN